MIGLVLGDTQLGSLIVKKLELLKKKFVIIDISKKKIFSSKNLHENLSKINGEYKDNELVQEVTNFISKDKKRPICSPIKN